MPKPKTRPLNPVQLRLEVSPEDHRRIFDAAHEARMSMSTFARTAVLMALDDPETLEAIKWAGEELRQTAD